MRTEDVLCRYGGEEFAVIVPNSNMAGAAELGERLRTAIAGTKIGPRPDTPGVTASFGIAELGGDQDEKTLLESRSGAIRASRMVATASSAQDVTVTANAA